MTPNEDGFIPVAQCLAALVKPPRFPVNRGSERFADRRRRLHIQVMKAGHPKHYVRSFLAYGASRDRVVISVELYRVLDACEDLDTLLTALLFIKKTTNNYADQPETR